MFINAFSFFNLQNMQNKLMDDLGIGIKLTNMECNFTKLDNYDSNVNKLY